MKQHSPGFLSLVEESKKRIKEISARNLKDMIDQQENFSLIDVREDHEWSTGHISGATHLGKGIIERDIEKLIPDFNKQIVVYCSGGFRCALVAESLQKMGYVSVYSLGSGLSGWTNEGYGIEKA